MSTEPESQNDQEPLPIRHVQTVEIRQKSGTNEYRATVTEAVQAAGLEEGATFQFKPYELDELGVIPALGAAADEDAPRDRYTRTATTDGKASVRVTLPKEVVEAIEAEVGREHENEQPLLVDVFAGERVIAIAPAEGFDVATEALPKDPDRVVADSREGVRLEAIQTARPRVKVMDEAGQSRMAELTITPAIRAAGLTADADEPYSVSYHPEAAESLGGLIPAVGYQRAADAGDPEYSVIREMGGNNDSQAAVYSVGLPTPLIEALGLTLDELEGLSRSERPQITVYAADGMLGFKTPTVREIAVESDRTSEFVDVDGIHETIAGRLRDRGYSSPEDLEGIAREDLLEIEGVSTNRADRILADLGGRGA